MSSFLFSSYLLHFNCKFVTKKKGPERTRPKRSLDISYWKKESYRELILGFMLTPLHTKPSQGEASQ